MCWSIFYASPSRALGIDTGPLRVLNLGENREHLIGRSSGINFNENMGTFLREKTRSQIREAKSCQVNSAVDLKKKGDHSELVQRYIFPLFHAFIHGTWDLAIGKTGETPEEVNCNVWRLRRNWIRLGRAAHEMAETQREQNQGGCPGLQGQGVQDKQTQTYLESRPRSVWTVRGFWTLSSSQWGDHWKSPIQKCMNKRVFESNCSGYWE